MRYRTIVADPPWPFKWTGGAATRVNGRGETHVNHKHKAPLPYDTMTLDAIARLDVGALADVDAHLYLWIPDKLLIEGVADRIVRAWGFTPGRLLIWHKRGFGLGAFPRPQHEAILVCKRGKLPFRVNNVGSVQDWKLSYCGRSREHSRKPDGFLDLVESASPGPYLELFARRQRLGWDSWGDEALEHVEVSS